MHTVQTTWRSSLNYKLSVCALLLLGTRVTGADVFSLPVDKEAVAQAGQKEPSTPEPARSAAKPEVKAPDQARDKPWLKKYDINHDGKLDDNELAAAKAALSAMRGAERERKIAWLKRMLARFDTNKDGKLDADEKAAAAEQMRTWIEQHPRALARFDLDGDGKLSDEEWQAAREKWQKRLEELRHGEE